MQTWAVASSFGVLSIIVSLTVPDAWVPLAGYLYFVLFPGMLLPNYFDRRRHPAG